MKTHLTPTLRYGAIALAGLCHCIALARQPSPAISCRVEPERSVLTANVQENITVKVSLTGAARDVAKERAPVNVSLVIDRSGSMHGERIAQAKAAAIYAVEQLSPEDIISIVIFDDRIETLVPAQHVTNKRDIVAKINGITARGSTAIFGGVSQGAAEIRKNLDRDYINRIVLLSDGQANVGPATPADLGRLGVALMKEKISVSTIGVGLGYNEDLMTRLAGQSDGNSYFAENDDDLPRIFQRELGDILSVAATAVRIKVNFPEGVVPVEIIGREGFIDGSVVSLNFNQIYGKQEKYVLIRSIFAPGKDGSTRIAANAEIEYYDTFLNKSQITTAAGSVRFSEDKGAVAKSVNKEVIREVEMNITAIETTRAIQLADEGKRNEAAAIMAGRADRLRRVAADYDMRDLAIEAKAQADTGAKLKEAPMAPAARKAMTIHSYAIQNQQASSASSRDTLKVQNDRTELKTVTVKTMTHRPRSSSYVVSGQVQYQGVKGEAYLEMWTVMPDGSRYFSRTLEKSGTMQKIQGTSKWRNFELPFNLMDAKPDSVTLEINVVMPDKGTIEISSVTVSDK